MLSNTLSMKTDLYLSNELWNVICLLKFFTFLVILQLKFFFFLLMKLLLFLVASRMDSNTSICWLNFIALTTFLFWLNLGV